MVRRIIADDFKATDHICFICMYIHVFVTLLVTAIAKY